MADKIVFITGTRADYGKLKPLMKKIDGDKEFACYVFVSGMHLLDQFGKTCKDVLNDHYSHIFIPDDLEIVDRMDISLARTITSFSKYVEKIKPDVIVVHGDRIDALAGAIVAMLNNILLLHIEGGEVTGTVDEAMRHAISKMANIHFVANVEARLRLIQLGEHDENIHIIGSPDIDIMLSGQLPDFDSVLKKYKIPFKKYALFIYHPVVSEVSRINEYMRNIKAAILQSNYNFIVIYPNNDHGAACIIENLHEIEQENIIIVKTVPFEDFLIFLKNCEFIMGNSSAGIREACVYGIPAIDLGTRQNKRYSTEILKNVMHTEENAKSILHCIQAIERYRYTSYYFGDGHSAAKFISILKQIIKSEIITQKKFIDTDDTQQAILNYINEVCF